MDRKAMGERLKTAAKRRGMTQGDVHRRVAELGVAVSDGTVENYFNGRTAPRLEVVEAMAQVLEASLDYLVRGIEPDGGSEYDDEERLVVQAYREAKADTGLTVTRAIARLTSPQVGPILPRG